MNRMRAVNRTWSAAALLAVLLLAGAPAYASAAADQPAFKQEELEQMFAPIALYPDSLLSQVLMASTYPLEVVQADRWIKKNADLKGDALAKALEGQSWDPSVKSLVNFPQVLTMMNENLDVTVKIGDAFIGQQKEVMETVQKLRGKAQETGNLKTTPEQKVAVERQDNTQVIVIEPADPQVVYVPTYSPTVYYSTWPYPAYPPYPYYPPGYVVRPGLAFAAGVGIGFAWGYAWGHCDWHGGDVDIDIDRHTDINTHIDRDKYKKDLQNRDQNVRDGKGSFQHDPSHRQGVAYRDQKTASQFGRATTADAAKARESFRGRTQTGTQGPSLGGAAGGRVPQMPTTTARPSAFDGVNRGGSAARAESKRGLSSRSTSSRSSAPSRSAGTARAGGRR